jgi:hypothetical protein
MNYKMTKPCDACPFLKGSGFTYSRLLEFSRGEFPCHKASDLVEDEDGFGEYHAKPGDKTPHCAGALIFNEKREQPHQMMRICERLGFYDYTKLDMEANVGSSPADYRKPVKGEK